MRAQTETIAIFAVLETTNMAMTFDEVLNALDDDNFGIDDAGISSEEEEDLDRRLESSGNDSRQVFICFYRTNVVLSCRRDILICIRRNNNV